MSAIEIIIEHAERVGELSVTKIDAARAGAERREVNAAISQCVVVLPWPDSSLLPNRSSGHHWAVKQPAKNAARLTAISKAQDFNIGDVTVDHAVTIILEPPDRRKHDVDGVLSALKPSLDGIAKALGIDDYHFNPVEIIRADPVEGGRVTVRIDDAIPF